MNLILIPIWLLSGAFWPVSGAPAPLAWAMRINPLTYGVSALRQGLYLGNTSAAGAMPAFASHALSRSSSPWSCTYWRREWPVARPYSDRRHNGSK